MRKIILLFLLYFSLQPILNAQFEVIGSNEYGRIFGVIYDQNTENKLYAITLSNHILTSVDNGQTWTIFHSLENGYFNRVDNNLQYYGSNHLSFVLHSLGNLGRTVNLLNLTSNEIDDQITAPDPNVGGNSWVSSYALSPSNADYAIISMGYPLGFGVAEKTYYTTDGGTSWEIIYDSTLNQDIIPGKVAIHPTHPEKLYITRGNGPTEVLGGILISEDGGQNWTEKLQGVVLNPISFHPENSSEIWIGTGIGAGTTVENLYKSTDAGNTWNVVPMNWSEYILDCINVIQFNPSNPSNMIILEENEVAISNDGGTTWQLTVYPDAYDNPEDYSYGLDASFNPFNGNEVFISANYYPMFSTDKGLNMERIKTPYFHSDGNLHYYSKNGENHLYYGVQNGFVHQNLNSQEEAAYDIMPIHFVTNNSGTTLIKDPILAGRVYSFAGSFMGSTLKVSDEHGANAEPIFGSFSNNLGAVAAVPTSEDIIWAAFSSGGDNPEMHAIDFSDISNVQTTAIELPNSVGAVMGILFQENNPNNVLIAQGLRVYKSSNAGATWTLSSNGLEPLNQDTDLIFKITKSELNPNQLSLVSTKGIFTSSDAGTNWSQVQTGVYHNYTYSPIDQNVLAVATHDSEISSFGIKISHNGGASWQEIDEESLMHLNSANIISSTVFHFTENLVEIFVGTSGLGVIKYTFDLSTLSIIDSEILDSTLVVLYPNPTSDFLNIQSKEEVQSVEIFSLSGQRILSDSTNKINISHLNTGTYIVQILFKNGLKASKKFIKK